MTTRGPRLTPDRLPPPARAVRMRGMDERDDYADRDAPSGRWPSLIRLAAILLAVAGFAALMWALWTPPVMIIRE